MLAFRNTTHHHVTNDVKVEEALRICAFLNVLLKVVDGAQVVGQS